MSLWDDAFDTVKKRRARSERRLGKFLRALKAFECRRDPE